MEKEKLKVVLEVLNNATIKYPEITVYQTEYERGVSKRKIKVLAGILFSYFWFDVWFRVWCFLVFTIKLLLFKTFIKMYVLRRRLSVLFWGFKWADGLFFHASAVFLLKVDKWDILIFPVESKNLNKVKLAKVCKYRYPYIAKSVVHLSLKQKVLCSMVANSSTKYYVTPFEILCFLGLDFSLMSYNVNELNQIRFQFNFI